MKKWMKSVVIIALMMPSLVKANEGMWLISLLNKINEAEMKGLGLNLTAEEIYSINQASLKDAIVRLNYGQCTGEVVSDKGLIFTNHHCAFDAIQTLSTVQNNMLANGFCAKAITEELPIPDFKIQFLVRIDNVTKEVLAALNDGMSEADREKAIAAKNKELSAAASENGKYEVEVKSFFHGNEFYTMVYQTFRDIRLVGNPPESVGKFGGDTDNWMWPRHTGDFSMLRIYANKSNEPADYSAENVPYKPKHFLPVNIGGIEEGDFHMVMGFPGRTNRFLTSFGVNQATEIRNPILIECLGTKLESWKSIMDRDAAVDLMYAAKYASTANGWKYYIGQNKGLKRLNVAGEKLQIEQQFNKWVGDNADRKAKYGEALTLIADYHKAWDPEVKDATYSNLAGVGGAEFMYFAIELGGEIEAAMSETDETKRNQMMADLKPAVEAHFKEYNVDVDRLVFVNLTNLHRKNVAKDKLPTWHQILDAKFKGSADAYAKKMFESSVFFDKAKLLAFLNKPNVKALQKDMAYTTAKSAYQHAGAFNAKNPREKMTKGYRQLTAGLREMGGASKQYAPDANSTLRLTYGVIDDYKAADAVHYDYYTTASGIMEKRDNTNPEFVVPDKLAELIQKKDFGKYANKKGELVTCFIGNLDITGGNSGSPVIDGDGNLIGIAFDGNWEAMSGDIAFEPELQRTISVDIRYVLFTVEKLMGGKNIIDELKFATKKPKPQPVAPAEPTLAPSATPAPSNSASPAPKDKAALKAEGEKKLDDMKKKAQQDAEKRKEDAKKAADKKAADLKGKGNSPEGVKGGTPAPAPKKK
jgi:hypothetical protein